jgi:YidC/Oxa1 family membrane protein insertase
LVLFDGDSTIFGLKFPTADRKYISTNDLFFTPQTEEEHISVSGDQSSLVMRMSASENAYLEYVYTLKQGSYMVDFEIRMVNFNEVLAANSRSFDLEWQFYIPGQEKGRDFENSYTSVYYQHFQDEVEYLSERSDMDEEDIPTRLKWVAYKQQFFSTVLIAGKSFEDGILRVENIKNDPRFLKFCSSKLSVPIELKPEEAIAFQFYFGPNHYKTLRSFEVGLQELVPLGWGIFGWVNRFAVIPIFNFLGTFISSYGIIILLMTIIIKLVLFPLTYRSYRSSAKMRVLRPQIEELTKNIPKEKAMERQQKTMEFYRKAGVNPMGGCLPVALQMPILIAMFRFFPASIELRQESFLWAEDLSSYDSVLDLPFTIPFYGEHVSLFTLLMTISTIIYTRMNQNQMGDASTQMPGMKTMMYLFPVMMLFWFNSYALLSRRQPDYFCTDVGDQMVYRRRRTAETTGSQ